MGSLKGEILTLKSKGETVTVNWKQGSFIGFGGDRSQNYVLCDYTTGNQRRLDTHHVTIFYQSNSSLNLLMADPESFPEARVVAVIFGFPSFLFNELSWNPSQWFDVKILFLGKSTF